MQGASSALVVVQLPATLPTLSVASVWAKSPYALRAAESLEQPLASELAVRQLSGPP